jgi:hypothetical protein
MQSVCRLTACSAIAMLLLIRLGDTAPAAADERVYYVSPTGDDNWSGRLADANSDRTDGPWKTVAKACASVQPGDTCRLRAGVYRQVLKPLRSGTADRPIVFEAQPGETVVLSGADPVGPWQAADDGVYKTTLDWDLADENQLFAGDVMLTEARWPNLQGTLLAPERARVATGSANTIVDPNLPGKDDFWNGAVLWCAGGHRWYCWSATVADFDSQTKTLTFEKPQPDQWYTPRAGNEYVLMGIRNALDAEGEWWFDRPAKTLWLKPPGGRDPNGLEIQAKRRIYTMDLSGLAHVQVRGIRFRAGGILTDADSHHLLFEQLTGHYIGHSYVDDVSRKSTVLIRGHHIELNRCELAYASGSLLRMEGHDNRLINCFLHDGDYAGKWNGVASFSGRRQLISHNTIRDSGRDVCSVHGLMESLIQYNDLSHSGWLTADLGMTYGHNTDFMGTVIRYNWVHDNLAHGHTAGIYFDHCSHNAIVHHNVVWNVPGMPLQVNNPAYFMLCYNNTLVDSGGISTFDHSHRDDMFGCRFQNNISAKPFKLPPHVVTQPNLIDPEPGLVAPEQRDFRLPADSPARGAGVPLPGIATGSAGQPPDLGAYPPQWRAGHDFASSPQVDWDLPQIAYSNAIRNAAFELGTLEYWSVGREGSADIVPGNGWGNGFGRGQAEKTGTSKHELRLRGRVRVEQTIENLHPNTRYQLSAWVKVTDPRAPVTLGVNGQAEHKGFILCADETWERKTLDFITAPDMTKVTVHIAGSSESCEAFVDNLGLPRVLPERDATVDSITSPR